MRRTVPDWARAMMMMAVACAGYAGVGGALQGCDSAGGADAHELASTTEASSAGAAGDASARCGTHDPSASSATGDLPSATWQAQAQRQIADSEYAARLDGKRFRAVNRAQGLLTHFNARGAELRAREGSGSGMRIGGAALVRGEQRVAFPSGSLAGETVLGACQTDGATDTQGDCLRRLETAHGEVTEVWENRRDGIEHSFIVHSAPTGAEELAVEIAIEGADVEIESDATAARFAQRDVTRGERALVLRYSGLRAWDASHNELSARMELRGSYLALVVDDRGGAAAYPVTIDPVLTSVSWSAEGDQASAFYGFSVASAGDVNGDSYGDVIVGAPFYDAGETDEGRAFLYLGSAAGLAATASWTAESDQAFAALGRPVASAGDVNGDGYGDVIIGASSFSNHGRAYVYLGGPAGLAAAPSWTAEGTQANEQFALSVSRAGDINGDGYGDVIVGAQLHDNGQTDEGRAFLYLGGATGLAVSATWSAESNQTGAAFGGKVGNAGDVNRDGYGDVIVGAHLYDNGETDEGRAFVYLGSASGLGASAAWTAESQQVGAAFGSSVAGAGDVDGDGFSDVIVGASLYDNGQTDEGRAYVYRGSATGLQLGAAWTAESNQATSGFGEAVASAGDANGDGYADVVVGASLYDNGQVDEGRAYVYFGSGLGLQLAAAWTSESNTTSAHFGSAVASAGDVNADGHADLVIGAHLYANGESNEGSAFVYLGTASGLSSSATWTSESDQSGANLGISVSSAGDVNGDGYGDVIAGARRYDNGQTDEGRAFLYLGGPAGLAQAAAWTAESNQANAFFGAAVASAGDVNGDGYGDVIVGAYFYDNAQTDEGRAYVYLGGSLGLATTPAWTAESDQAGASFGAAVASAGDVNGDGYSDVIVGAYLHETGDLDEGGAFLYLGSASGLGVAAAWSDEPDQPSAAFGISVASAGDVNGDGFDDVVVGAYAYSSGSASEGLAFAYLGSATGLSPAPTWTAESNQAQAFFGSSVASAGDVNGDGYSDIVVGAPFYDNGQSDEGRAFVYLGSATGLATTAAWTAESDQASAFFGQSVASAGDVNGDGYADVIIGADWYDSGQLNEGRASVYLGSASGLPAVASTTMESDQTASLFGSSVASAGDVNGDGYGDVIVGARSFTNGQGSEGRAFAYFGNRGDGTGSAFSLHPQPRRSGTTIPIAAGNSLTVQGFDVNTGVGSHFGRARAKLELEVKPSGEAFDGLGTVLAANYEDITAVTSRTLSSGTIDSGSGYHFRTRLRYDANQSIGQASTHWFYGGLSGQAQGVHLRTCGDEDDDGHPSEYCGGDDLCPTDASKVAPLICGCGISDTDTDLDGTSDCLDACPSDATKVSAGICGCGVPDTDSDLDATADCQDGCPADAGKVNPGVCGCGIADTDTDLDGTADCIDACPTDAGKVAPGICGCGVADTDTDLDGTADCLDGCPADPSKIAPGVCGCGVVDSASDIDNDGTVDCIDGCPSDGNKIAPGQCGCGVLDTDSDGDGSADCVDLCPEDPSKIALGVCGCGEPDVDGDHDGVLDCVDACPADPLRHAAPCTPRPAPVPAMGSFGLAALALLLLVTAISRLRSNT